MKIQSPWMGRIKGSAGNMTGSKVYDKNVLRAKAFEVSNPNTPAQQTERSFFAQVADCCASVSEEQLRSLFGVKPKSMSRRNALTKQVAAAFTIEGTAKVLDFSKLPAIGNGEKVNTPIVKVENGMTQDETLYDTSILNLPSTSNGDLIVVFFNKNTNKIELLTNELYISDEYTSSELADLLLTNKTGWFYVTCSNKGENVSTKTWGSFIMKTRATN